MFAGETGVEERDGAVRCLLGRQVLRSGTEP